MMLPKLLFGSEAMTAERFSASLANQLSLPGTHSMPQGYYRSKLFIAPLSTNPLIAAAGPLLSLLERLHISPSLPSINSIRDNIEHELYAFHSRIRGKDYTEELAAIAHYLLCATIDELLGKNYLRLFGKVAEFKAFTPSSTDQVGPERRFFDIITVIKERPNQYLDLIELAYYCLIAGFEGEQHGKAEGRQVLENLIEELYQIIQQYRVNKSHRLFKEQKQIENFPKSYKPFLLGSVIALVLLLSGFLTSHFLLENQASVVQFGHAMAAKLDD